MGRDSSRSKTMTFCDQITDETKAEMRNLIDHTKETGREHGMTLCEIDDKIVTLKCALGKAA